MLTRRNELLRLSFRVTLLDRAVLGIHYHTNSFPLIVICPQELILLSLDPTCIARRLDGSEKAPSFLGVRVWNVPLRVDVTATILATSDIYNIQEDLS